MFRTASTEIGRRGRPAARARSSAAALACALLLSFASLRHSAPAQAAGPDFRSIGTAAAVMYDGPSAKGRKMFVAPRGMPVEVLATVNNWVKVRDQAGDVLWVDRAELAGQRTVVAVALATVRSSPLDTATVVFQADKGVVLDVIDPAPATGWVRVRHRDGAFGFVKAAEVWGV